MTCDHCKAPIQPGEPYSVTEYGRLHSACFREVSLPVEARGPYMGDGRADPVYVLGRMALS